jgi:hypothetical protein
VNRLMAGLIAACWLAAGAVAVLAHDGAEDIAWVYVSGNQADGRATVRVDIAELAVCDRVEPLRLEGVRGEREASGTLERVEPCRFEGEIALPEPGRWMVAARFELDEREAEVWTPVGVTETAQAFERGDWLHAVEGEEAGWTSSRTLLLALGGLIAGGLLTVAYRRFGPSTRTALR